MNVNRYPVLAALLIATAPSMANAQAIPDESTPAAQAAPGVPPTAHTKPVPMDENDPRNIPVTNPPPVPLVSPDKPLKAAQRRALNIASKWQSKAAVPSLGDDGVVRFAYGSGQPTIICAPLTVCDLALQPGEVVTTQPHVGDNVQWRISNGGMSGSPPNQVTHVMIKPIDAGLTTNLSINTDRRSYSINLVSRRKDYMPKVAFDYPEDAEKSWESYLENAAVEKSEAAVTPAMPCDQAPSIPPNGFSISDRKKSWSPVQVYAVATPVGQKTCIQFPADISSYDLPAVLAVADDGGWFSDPSVKMINARFSNNRYMVDGVYPRLALIHGVGRGQERITIEQKGSQ